MGQKAVDVFILTGETRSGEGGSSAIFYGVSAQGPVKIEHAYHPYFFTEMRAALPQGIALRSVPGSREEEEKFTSLSNVEVRRVEFSSIHDAERARKYLRNSGFSVFESDVRHRERFLMDHRINGGVRVEGECSARAGMQYFKNPRLIPARVSLPFKVCSLDIETSMSEPQVLSIAMHFSGAGSCEHIVLIQGAGEDLGEGISCVPGERELLIRFQEYVRKADPDLIIGWNVIGFDLSYLAERAEALGLNLNLGRENRSFSLSEQSGRFSRVNMPGRVVLDGPQLLRTSFHTFESYSLENVSQKVLGEGKLIESNSNKGEEIERLFRDDKRALAEYNLKDTVLVTRIFEKLRLLDLTVKRSELSGMLLDQVGMSTASLDHFYLPRLHDENYVAPDVADVKSTSFGSGGYVMSPAPGIYDDIIALDFQSLYPTIIRTFGIDPLSRACAAENPLVTPTGFKFSRTRSILPRFIGELMDERRIAKTTNNAPLSQAIKILMNSFYGVMGSWGSRLFHPDLPDAITSTGQWLFAESKKWLEARGERVIYGDTDSLFVQLGKETRARTKDFAEVGTLLAKDLTQWWSARVREECGVESYLIVEFEKHYKKFLLPVARGSAGKSGEGGAKKRYAGLVIKNDKEDIEFVGLEVVRSDWTRLARDFQHELYSKIFRGEPVDEWMREFVAQVRKGLHNEKLTYRKRLHKPLGEYGASPPPYVRAALLLPKAGREVRYVMTLQGPVPIELNPINPDYTHYVERQLRPVADSILEAVGRSFDEILSPQLRLL